MSSFTTSSSRRRGSASRSRISRCASSRCRAAWNSTSAGRERSRASSYTSLRGLTSPTFNERRRPRLLNRSRRRLLARCLCSLRHRSRRLPPAPRRPSCRDNPQQEPVRESQVKARDNAAGGDAGAVGDAAAQRRPRSWGRPGRRRRGRRRADRRGRIQQTPWIMTRSTTAPNPTALSPAAPSHTAPSTTARSTTKLETRMPSPLRPPHSALIARLTRPNRPQIPAPWPRRTQGPPRRRIQARAAPTPTLSEGRGRRSALRSGD